MKKMKQTIIITSLALLSLLSTVSCNQLPADLSYHWNRAYEYGTLYPTFMGEIHYPQNVKGFSVENDESVLWADCYLIRLRDNNVEEYNGEFIEGYNEEYAINYLRDDKGPVVLVDTTFMDNNNIVLNKVIAYYGVDPMFYEIKCTYPADKEVKYGELYRKCVSEFPCFRKHFKLAK